MNYKQLFLIPVLWLLSTAVSAQTVGVSTNALGWGTLTPNIGLDVGLARHFTLEVDAAVNPFKYSDNKSTRFWAVQPEFKYWFREKFRGPSVGLHGTYGSYDFGVLKYVYSGNMYGGGLSLNYAWMLGKNWNLEASLGGGFTRLDQSDKCLREDPLTRFGPAVEDKWGLSRVGVTFTRFFGKTGQSRTSALDLREQRAEERRLARSDYEFIRAAVREGINEYASGRKDTVYIIKEVPAAVQTPEYEEIQDSKSFEILFEQGSDKPCSVPLSDLFSLLYDGSLVSRSINIVASCSPEGGEKLNKDLAGRRADWMLGRLDDVGIPSASAGLLVVGADWDNFEKLVSESGLTHSAEILDIIRGQTERSSSLVRIRRDYPEDWKEISETLFPKLRNVTVVVDYIRKVKK